MRMVPVYMLCMSVMKECYLSLCVCLFQFVSDGEQVCPLKSVSALPPVSGKTSEQPVMSDLYCWKSEMMRTPQWCDKKALNQAVSM